MANKYWAERMAKSQRKLSAKSEKQIKAQLRKYYAQTMNRCISDFEATYDKLLLTVGENKAPTPADLYKLDKYWQMQAQLKDELRKLGAHQIAALSKTFEANFFDIYYSTAIPGEQAFNTIDKEIVQQMINNIWVADGKSWSARVWEDTEMLAETLNEQLIQCVSTGKKTSELKKALMGRFSVSYHNAEMVARTELAHIQTQAAQKRYQDSGIQYMEVWADEDERRCKVCGKLHQQRFPIGAQPPVPAHPNCRCCIIPVVE